MTEKHEMKFGRSSFRLHAALCMSVISILNANAQGPLPAEVSRQTVTRWEGGAWWPTSGAPARDRFAGAEACTGCHLGIASMQRKTPMFHAASLPSEAELLRKYPSLPFSEDGYDYTLSTGPNQSLFTIKSDVTAVKAPVAWAFGSGEVAQTYVMKRESQYLESRLSYYTTLRSLNITTGHSATPPSTIAEAAGDVIEPEIAARCFGCHTTASTAAGVFEPEKAVMGVTCEACHGPGAGHVAAMKTGTGANTIFAANTLSPVDSVDFCGACHRTPVDVAVEMPADIGIANLRFQPYRLERSHCWGEKGDARITCVACHDPHKPLVREAAAYDGKCLQCHAATGAAPTATQRAGCKVAAKECTSCHMPKYEIPAVHAEFTDHYIRVVRPDSGFRP